MIVRFFIVVNVQGTYMFGFLKSKKNRAIDFFCKDLRTLLEKEYGKKEHYTEKQISTVIEANQPANMTYLIYALFLYASLQDVNAYNQSIGELYDTESLGDEIQSAMPTSFLAGGYEGGGFDGGGFDGGA